MKKIKDFLIPELEIPRIDYSDYTEEQMKFLFTTTKGHRVMPPVYLHLTVEQFRSLIRKYVDLDELLREWNDVKKVAIPTMLADILLTTYHDHPEICKLWTITKSVSFTNGGIGMGRADVDEYDLHPTQPMQQLLVMDTDTTQQALDHIPERVLFGGYRVSGASEGTPMTGKMKRTDQCLNFAELGRAAVNIVHQGTKSGMMAVLYGLGYFVFLHKDTHDGLYGKITLPWGFQYFGGTAIYTAHAQKYCREGRHMLIPLQETYISPWEVGDVDLEQALATVHLLNPGMSRIYKRVSPMKNWLHFGNYPNADFGDSIELAMGMEFDDMNKKMFKTYSSDPFS